MRGNDAGVACHRSVQRGVEPAVRGRLGSCAERGARAFEDAAHGGLGRVGEAARVAAVELAARRDVARRAQVRVAGGRLEVVWREGLEVAARPAGVREEADDGSQDDGGGGRLLGHAAAAGYQPAQVAAARGVRDAARPQPRGARGAAARSL